MLTRFALMLCAAVATACNDPAQASYEHRLHREIVAFEFQAPLARVWPELVQVLAENGFELRETWPVVGRTVTSELRPDHGGNDSGYRALVRANQTAKGRYSIRIELQYESRDGDKVRRSIESWNVTGLPTDRMNWTLIERAEPERAAAILRRITPSGS